MSISSKTFYGLINITIKFRFIITQYDRSKVLIFASFVQNILEHKSDIQNIIDMPDNKVDRMILFLHQN